MQKCYVCDKEDFHGTGDLHTQNEILICKTCGNVFHKIENDREKKIKEYYKSGDYRQRPSHKNLLTTANKQNYISHFLNEFLTKAKEDKRNLLLVMWVRRLVIL